MTTALTLLGIQGVIGAFDTLYYHEWKARLPARGRIAAPELRLHAAWAFAPAHVAVWFRWLLTVMGVGVILSGVRDLYAALELPKGAWPWRSE